MGGSCCLLGPRHSGVALIKGADFPEAWPGFERVTYELFHFQVIHVSKKTKTYTRVLIDVLFMLVSLMLHSHVFVGTFTFSLCV